MATGMCRREFVRDALGAAALGALGGCAAGAAKAEIRKYPGWRPGELDMHLIHTGTSENTFMVFPDGTTMLLDCGYIENRRPGYAEAISPAPDGSRRSGEWVRRYIERLIPQREIDYLMVSHWHGDHFAGIPDVAKSFRFLNYYDHQYPNIGQYRKNADVKELGKFQEWLSGALAGGMKREPFKVGAENQIRLLHDTGRKYADAFQIRNLAANGVVWNGKDGIVDCAAEHVKATGEAGIWENTLSSAILIRYGGFTYFTGGDLEGEFTGADGAKYSYEARVGEVAGPVSVCKVNHHGYWTAMQDGFVKAVRPKLFIASSWSPNQQNLETLGRMMSPSNYEGPRTVAYGAIPDFRMREFRENGLDGCLAPAGHAVVKVEPGGGAFKLYTLSAMDETMNIVGIREFKCT